MIGENSSIRCTNSGESVLANKCGDQVVTRLLKVDSCHYPDKLKMYLADCNDLFIRGNVELLKSPAIAVVGSRECSSYGISVAKSIGRTAAQFGITIVSGLARGIDTAAHQGALEEGGNTIAVLANGLDLVYPKENRKIQGEISRKGLLVSEYPDGTSARPYSFPIRNRIIAALSEFVVVVEAKERSGSLITAELCADQGKEIFAVPGYITSKNSFGTNKLIRDGARIVTSVDEMFKEAGFTRVRKEEHLRGELGLDELVILKVIENSSELTFDEISEKTGFSVSYINGIITVLEIKGFVTVEMGRVFI